LRDVSEIATGAPAECWEAAVWDDDSSYISELKVWLEFFDDDLKLGV
jgi:hypothetical protein